MLPQGELIAAHGAEFVESLALLGTRRKDVNVLLHLMGYLERDLSGEDKPVSKLVWWPTR